MVGATEARAPASQTRLDATTAFTMDNGRADVASYKGRRSIHLQPPPGHELTDESVLAILTGTDFKDGTIEVEVAGKPRPNAGPGARGFIGIAFRVQPKPATSTGHVGKFPEEPAEYFYLRPTNARSNEQLTRNHSAQYVSEPDYPWQRLRQENPGEYESYVDLVPGEWTKMRIEVEGTKARLYVNDARQPCLVINDLKRGDVRGAIALWAHAGTDAFFANLKVTPASR
jgi:hypothetical protein